MLGAVFCVKFPSVVLVPGPGEKRFEIKKWSAVGPCLAPVAACGVELLLISEHCEEYTIDCAVGTQFVPALRRCGSDPSGRCCAIAVVMAHFMRVRSRHARSWASGPSISRVK